MKYLSTEEADALMHALERLCRRVPHYLAAFYLMRYAGCRIGETRLVSARDFTAHPFPGVSIITLKRRVPGTPRVPLPDEGYERCQQLVRRAGDRMRSVDRSRARWLMHWAGDIVGISDRSKLHPHVFRHTRAIEFLRAGLSIPEVARLLGHAEIRSTMRYLDIAPVDIYHRLKETELWRNTPSRSG